MLVNLFRFKELNMCLRKLSIVDDTLKMLGIAKEYRRLYNLAIRLIIGWIVLICLLTVSDNFTSKCNYFTNCIIVPLMGKYLLYVNTFNGIIWGTILRYIGSKFQQINKCVHNMLEDKKGHVKKLQKLILIQQRTEAKERKQLIWIIMHVHLELVQISRIWNKVFSVQMTLQMTSYFALMISTCLDFYTAYIMKKKREHTVIKQFLNILNVYFWAVLCNANLLTLNYSCQSVCDETKKTVTMLHKLSNDNFDKNLREQIVQFILQIKQTEIKFSGMGTFHFGYKFIRQFYMSAATVIVFIIQMRY
ncbi:putative gustatory receptor 28b [Linepithema humile]|uniref:putative gustatory receptor 28b n=1 Tax=Linepithema humile TaxID=83485 RepID=UPI00351F1820